MANSETLTPPWHRVFHRVSMPMVLMNVNCGTIISALCLVTIYLLFCILQINVLYRSATL